MADADILATKVCTKCGEAKPATFEYYANAKSKLRLSSQCRRCGIARTQKWRSENPELAKEQNKRVYQGRRQAAAEYGKKYRAENRDRIAKWQREWFIRNRESWYSYRAEWHGRNPNKKKDYAHAYILRDTERYRRQIRAMYEKHKAKRLENASAWKSANRAACRALCSAYRARKMSAGGKHTAADIFRQLNGQKGRCWWCQKRLKKYHVDHRIPLKLGGSNGPENIVISCPPCNQRKAARMPWESHIPRLV